MRLSHLLACLPLLAGCIPYAGPSLDYTPRVNLDVPREEVRAFRVDITRNKYDGLFSGTLTKTDSERLSEVPISARDVVPAQVKTSITTGIVVIGIALNYRVQDAEAVALRLYRPGYELVEVKSWEPTNRVDWKPAADLLAQEEAVDRLFGGKRDGDEREAGRVFRAPVAGSVSATHREALLFGMGEYERLAQLAGSTEQGKGLVAKAKAMRALADH